MMHSREHGMLHICAVRYALGEPAYTAGVIIEQVMQSWHGLHYDDRKTLFQEVKREVEICETYSVHVGGEDAHYKWREFVEWMEEKMSDDDDE